MQANLLHLILYYNSQINAFSIDITHMMTVAAKNKILTIKPFRHGVLFHWTNLFPTVT